MANSADCKDFGKDKGPGPDLLAYAARANVDAAYEAVAKGALTQAAGLLASAETEAISAQKMWQAYFEGIINAGEMTVKVLEITRDTAFVTLTILATVATAGAAAGVTSLAGVELGAASTANAIAMFAPLAREIGEAGLKLTYSDQVDWGQLAIDAAVTIILSKFGGKLSQSIAGRTIGQNPAAASLGRNVVAGNISDVVTGRAATLVSTTIRTLYQTWRGKKINWEGYVDQVAASLTDPKSLALDILLGAIGTYAARKGATKAPGEPLTARSGVDSEPPAKPPVKAAS